MNIAMYKDGRYFKAEIADGHLVRDVDSDNFIEIYDVWAKCYYGIILTEEILQNFNIPNLGYVKTDNGFQIFDTSKEEYTEEECRVYVDVFGSIKQTKKWVTIKTPTQEAIEASKAMYKKVEAELIKLNHKDGVKYLRQLVKDGNGIAYINTRTNYIYNMFNILYAEGIKVLFSYHGKYIIGNVAKKPVLDVYVPETIVPMVIGRGGEMIKKIAAEINAKRINVHPIES